MRPRTELVSAGIGYKPSHVSELNKVHEFRSFLYWNFLGILNNDASGWILNNLEVFIVGLIRFTCWIGYRLSILVFEILKKHLNPLFESHLICICTCLILMPADLAGSS